MQAHSQLGKPVVLLRFKDFVAKWYPTNVHGIFDTEFAESLHHTCTKHWEVCVRLIIKWKMLPLVVPHIRITEHMMCRLQSGTGWGGNGIWQWGVRRSMLPRQNSICFWANTAPKGTKVQVPHPGGGLCNPDNWSVYMILDQFNPDWDPGWRPRVNGLQDAPCDLRVVLVYI